VGADKQVASSGGLAPGALAAIICVAAAAFVAAVGGYFLLPRLRARNRVKPALVPVTMTVNRLFREQSGPPAADVQNTL
jgi:hypothetical protein